MLWKKKKCLTIMAILILSFSALSFETVHNGKSVQSGRLIIGSSRTKNETKDGIVKVHDEYAGYANEYQSDQPVLTGSPLAGFMLRRWSPSMWCDEDSMTLCIQGSRIPNFLVETGEKGLVPLSQLPSECGFSMKRARRDVALVAKYDGCNVAQQGDTYILPLRVFGTVVKLVCPVARPLTTVSCSPSAMVVNLGMSPDAVRLKVNGSWQPVNQASTTCGFTLEVGDGLTLTAPYTSNCWQFEGAEMFLSMQYAAGELTLSCPAVPLPATTPLPAHTHFPPTSPVPNVPLSYPFHGHVRPWYFNYSPLGTLSNAPTTATTTTTPTTTPDTTVSPSSADQPLVPNINAKSWYPWLHGMYKPYAYGMPRYFLHGHPGTLSNAATTKTPTTTPDTTVAPSNANQLILYPWFPGMCKSSGYGVPWYFHQGWPGMLSNAPTTATTTMTKTPTTTPDTTIAPSNAEQPILYPWLPGMYNPYVPVNSPAVPVSGSGGKPQYLMPWINALPRYPGL